MTGDSPAVAAFLVVNGTASNISKQACSLLCEFSDCPSYSSKNRVFYFTCQQPMLHPLKVADRKMILCTCCLR